MKILFDCDGTILDSMHIWTEPLYKIFEKYNYFPNQEEKGYMESLDYKSMIKWISKNIAKDMSPDDIDKIFQNIINDGYSNFLMPKEGVLEILKQLKNQGFEMAIASSTNYKLLEICMKRLNIFDYFKFIITPDTCKFNKSDIGYWKMAVDNLSTTPENVILYDDALYAVKAAKKAGIKTCGLKDFPYNEKEWKEIVKNADVVLDTIADIDINSLK